MRKFFILTAIMSLLAMSGFAQVKVWKNNEVKFLAAAADIDSITFGTPYQCLALNEVSEDGNWVEIYNSSAFEIKLEGIKLMKLDASGNAEELCTFSTESVQGNSWFVKKVGKSLAGTDNLVVALYTPENKAIDTFDRYKVFRDKKHAGGGSYSRLPDGIGEWKIVSEATENAKNNYGAAEMPYMPITLLHKTLWAASVATFPADEAIFLKTKDKQLVIDPATGDYAYITARAFAEEFRDKYNAANGTNVTIEDVLTFDYTDGRYYEITFADDMTCHIWDGQATPYGQVASLKVSGKYTLDEENGIIYVEDTGSNSLYDKEVEIKVTKKDDGSNGLVFEIIKKKILDPAYDTGMDYDMFGYSLYDFEQVNAYYPAKKILYHCSEIEQGHH